MISQLQDEFHLYDGQVPDFVEAELDTLYGVRYSTWPHFTAQFSFSHASTFTISRDGKMLAILIFLVRKNVLTVLNEGIRVDSPTIATFAKYMFARNRHLDTIRFNAVEIDSVRLNFPYYCAICASDLVMPLPAGRDWMSTLSAQYRSQVRRNIRRMQSLHSSFVFELHEKEAVDPRDVSSIIDMNTARMTLKKKKASIDAVEKTRIMDFVRKRGFVGVIRIQGELRAGVILYRLGNNYALRTLAHDAAYDHYSIGITALVLTIERAAMEKIGGTFFFGWGDEGYKRRLGAHQRELRRLIVYRTSWSFLQHPGITLGAVLAGVALKARHRLHRMRRSALMEKMWSAASIARPS